MSENVIFFRLPDDVYQTAKIAKILHLMETGKAADFKNKNLDEIQFDMKNEVVDEIDEENEKPGLFKNSFSSKNNKEKEIIHMLATYIH